MALLYLDGFDDYTTSDFNKLGGQAGTGVHWSYFYNPPTISTTTIRTTQTAPVTGKSMMLDSTSILCSMNLMKPTLPLYVGFAWRATGAGLNNLAWTANNFCVVNFASACTNLSYQGPTSGLGLCYNLAGNLVVAKRSDGTVLGTSSSTFTTNTWYYLEIKYVYSSTVGQFVLKVNGSTEINLTGIDTTAGASYFRGVGFGPVLGPSQNFFYDDVYVCDSSGTKNNDFLGPVSVYTLLPTANSSVAMTASAGSNFSCVNGVPYSTSYVQATAAAQTDLYTLTQLPGALTPTSIPGIFTKAVVGKARGTGSKMSFAASSGGTAYSANLPVPAGPTKLMQTSVFENDASAAAWTKTSINALTAGVKSV